MTQFEINSDISVARCLSPSFYLDDVYFESSRDHIFSRTWQFAGLKSDADNIRPVTLLEGFLDEPLIVTYDGELRCFSNVCTHRGNLLVSESCRGASIRCGYHGRKFDLSGKF
ncbi:MAG: Rieske 2Fe-2S domain-containing protein, partial [Acidobacteriota bacterium]|nr:Rieske 2Fe-2S domain-containing protein [Acidobacteriota bacterium]